MSPCSSWQSPLRRSPPAPASPFASRASSARCCPRPWPTPSRARSPRAAPPRAPARAAPRRAFDSATHHNWKGTYSSGLGVEITSVLGETHPFSAKGYYWGFWVNDKFASAGICDLKLKPGDQLLLAPAPGSGTTYPIVLTAPAKATAGRSFSVKAAYFKTSKGKAKALAGVKVTDAGAVTAHNGDATVTVTKPGKVTLVATLKGYIRAEATVNVTK